MWYVHLDLCTWSIGTVQSLEMASLIGFPVICALVLQELSTVWKWILWSVFLDLISLICALVIEELSTVWKWIPWSVHFDDRISLIFALDFTGNVQSLEIVSLIGFPWSVHVTTGTVHSLEIASLIGFPWSMHWINRNCPQFGNGFLDLF